MAKRYINILEEQLEKMEEQKADVEEWLDDFRRHLALPKFQGVDVNGDRKDWIAVSDVQKWLDELASRLD